MRTLAFHQWKLDEKKWFRIYLSEKEGGTAVSRGICHVNICFYKT